jgi:very-short-patch-repair endonuclease
LRKNQIRGVKFRRQLAIERFIADFCAASIRLIVEVDGPINAYTQAEDHT